MNEFLYGLIGAVGMPLVLFLWQLILKREAVMCWGMRAGAFCRKFLFQRVGVNGGEKLTERLISTVGVFIEGLYLGMRGGGAGT